MIFLHNRVSVITDTHAFTDSSSTGRYLHSCKQTMRTHSLITFQHPRAIYLDSLSTHSKMTVEFGRCIARNDHFVVLFNRRATDIRFLWSGQSRSRRYHQFAVFYYKQTNTHTYITKCVDEGLSMYIQIERQDEHKS